MFEDDQCAVPVRRKDDTRQFAVLFKENPQVLIACFNRQVLRQDHRFAAFRRGHCLTERVELHAVIDEELSRFVNDLSFTDGQSHGERIVLLRRTGNGGFVETVPLGHDLSDQIRREEQGIPVLFRRGGDCGRRLKREEHGQTFHAGTE